MCLFDVWYGRVNALNHIDPRPDLCEHFYFRSDDDDGIMHVTVDADYLPLYEQTTTNSTRTNTIQYERETKFLKNILRGGQVYAYG